MNHESKGTKESLINAAGELFAEKGFEGASVRAIVKKAGANIAAINYHFGTKENLFLETLLFAADKCTGLTQEILAEKKNNLNTTEEIAETIYEIVVKRFERIYTKDQPLWYEKILFRSLIEPSAALEVVVKNVFNPEHQSMMDLVKKIKTDYPEEKLQITSFQIDAQISFYAFGRSGILITLGQEEYDPAFMGRIAHHIALTTLSNLDLPIPEKYQ